MSEPIASEKNLGSWANLTSSASLYGKAGLLEAAIESVDLIATPLSRSTIEHSDYRHHQLRLAHNRPCRNSSDQMKEATPSHGEHLHPDIAIIAVTVRLPDRGQMASLVDCRSENAI